MNKNQTKSKQRVADHGEVFTAKREVNAMLDLVKADSVNIFSRFLEPACGDGNFLAEVLCRKLSTVKLQYSKNAADYERYAVIAVSSVYGVDILQDNIEECRKRLFRIFDEEYSEICRNESNNETRETVRYILECNILCGDALTMEISKDNPIIFAEWSAINGCMLKRRDYRLDHMLKQNEDNEQMSLCDYSTDYDYDSAGNFILKPIKEYEPIHYKAISKQRNLGNV